MSKKRFTTEQIMGILREVEVFVSKGKTYWKYVVIWGSQSRPITDGARNMGA